jgi:hypothetical protein
MQLHVFLDTSVLLKGFAAYRNNHPPPPYLCDSQARRYTFEKCVFEAFMAFRGIGGKKPDEGRQDWAIRNLKLDTDPSPVGKLISQVHEGDKARAYYWLNQILEAGVGIDKFEWSIMQRSDSCTCVANDDTPCRKPADTCEYHRALAEIQGLRKLMSERRKFDILCGEFHNFLSTYAIREIPYCEVFDFQKGATRQVSPACLEGFVKDTALPSEDFEIVYAAMTIPADILVTDDRRLINCAWSLGLNYQLHVSRFCRPNEYESKAEQIRLSRGV